MSVDQALRTTLLSMSRRDAEVRAELAADGSLFHGYHPQMEALHLEQAASLSNILDEHGWPGRGLVGEDGEEAAWLIAQHAISLPPLQRHARDLLRGAAEHGEAPWWQVAMLEDRIAALEGRPQRYGTQTDWDERGQMSLYPLLEDPDHVDERRRRVGLGPLEEDLRRRRAAIAAGPEQPPTDVTARRREMDEWARRVGWRK